VVVHHLRLIYIIILHNQYEIEVYHHIISIQNEIDILHHHLQLTGKLLFWINMDHWDHLLDEKVLHHRRLLIEMMNIDRQHLCRHVVHTMTCIEQVIIKIVLNDMISHVSNVAFNSLVFAQLLFILIGHFDLSSFIQKKKCLIRLILTIINKIWCYLFYSF
jgi:hypothetical protein